VQIHHRSSNRKEKSCNRKVQQAKIKRVALRICVFSDLSVFVCVYACTPVCVCIIDTYISYICIMVLRLEAAQLGSALAACALLQGPSHLRQHDSAQRVSGVRRSMSARRHRREACCLLRSPADMRVGACRRSGSARTHGRETSSQL
jgi:hypothetical protein